MLRRIRDGHWDGRDMHPRYQVGAHHRRRNRAREVETVRREVNAVELTCEEPGCHPRYHDSYWDMNDDHAAPTAEVWRALVENEQGLRFVNFTGSYRTESRAAA